MTAPKLTADERGMLGRCADKIAIMSGPLTRGAIGVRCSLERLGLIERVADQHWRITDAGRAALRGDK